MNKADALPIYEYSRPAETAAAGFWRLSGASWLGKEWMTMGGFADIAGRLGDGVAASLRQ